MRHTLTVSSPGVFDLMMMNPRAALCVESSNKSKNVETSAPSCVRLSMKICVTLAIVALL
jgi:hypothetical protein